MNAHDFIYDGIKLSDKGYALCKFSDSGIETIANGSIITWNKVPVLRGRRHLTASILYDQVLTTTFTICKNPCDSVDVEPITVEEMRELMRWLNRQQTHRFQFVDGDYKDYFFNATFNVGKIEIGGLIYGLELTMETDSPFAHKDIIRTIGVAKPSSGDWRLSVSDENGHIMSSKSIAFDSSTGHLAEPFYIDLGTDEEGAIVPDKMTVLMYEAGTLQIQNAETGKITTVSDCSQAETITFEYPMVSSNFNTRKSLSNYFNWRFPKLGGYGPENDPLSSWYFYNPGTYTIYHAINVKLNL